MHIKSQAILEKIKRLLFANRPSTKVFPGQGRRPFREKNKIKNERNKFESLRLFDVFQCKYKIPSNFKPHNGMDPQGLWQLQFLISVGLKPDSKLLDIGCGDLREGVPLIRFLNEHCYFGVDQSSSALFQGFQSIKKSDKSRSPKIYIGGDFGFEKLDLRVDFCWANSVFTHIDISLIGKCMSSAFQVLNSGGVFYATYFEPSSNNSWIEPELYRDSVKDKFEEKYLYSYRNPYMHDYQLLKFVAESIGFEVSRVNLRTQKKQSILKMVKP